MIRILKVVRCIFILGCINLNWVGDGYCDDDTNNMECNFDGGDCCESYTDTQFCKRCQCLGEGNKTQFFLNFIKFKLKIRLIVNIN